MISRISISVEMRRGASRFGGMSEDREHRAKGEHREHQLPWQRG
jgi:hypothetical protein